MNILLNKKNSFYEFNRACQSQINDIEVVHEGQIFDICLLREKLGCADCDDLNLLFKSAYLKWQEDFIKHIKGEFIVAVFDPARRKLIAARDRAGRMPLYYLINDKVCLFSRDPYEL